MPVSYLHGVETLELKKGPVPVTVVKSAVIGLVGIAPIGTANTPIVVQSERDAAQFGSPLTGFNIPKALADIFKQGAGTVIVVNTFTNSNLSTVTDEALPTTAGGKTKTAFNPVSNLVVKKGVTTLTLDTHYSVDEYGNIEVINFVTVPDGTTTLTASYKKLNAASVNADQIIGEYDSETDARTGMKCFDLCFNMFGFTPRILIAPGYSVLSAVSTNMISVANKFRAHALIDAPEGTAVSDAITGRGPLGEINFNTSSKRAVLCYPMLKAYDIATDSNEDRPYSQFLAGVIAATDNSRGYWVSPSNKEILGIVGVERNISAAVNDASTDANLLNEKGIVTLFNSFGTGIRTWGNRSAAFPTKTDPSNFIAVQRTADILHESLELAMLQFIDEPINQALIDSITETVNGFMRVLVQRGAIVDGKCTYDVAKNPDVEVAAGHLTFDINFMPPTPAERITFESFIDISLLRSLGTSN